jgi:Fe2+ transport system protein FeoA
MKRLNEVETNSKVIVKKIEGGTDIKKYLEDLGVREGVELNILSTRPHHKHRGPLCIEIEGKEIIIAQGLADKAYVEKDKKKLSLLNMEKGDKGNIMSIEGGREFENWLSELDVKEGIEVSILRHIPDDTLVFKIGDREIKLGEGQASKIFVEYKEKSIQSNYLKQGMNAKITKIIGGTELAERLEEIGIKEGTKISFVRKEEQAPISVKGTYVQAKIGENTIAIGHGMAEKIWVDNKE